MRQEEDGEVRRQERKKETAGKGEEVRAEGTIRDRVLRSQKKETADGATEKWVRATERTGGLRGDQSKKDTMERAGEEEEEGIIGYGCAAGDALRASRGGRSATEISATTR